MLRHVAVSTQRHQIPECIVALLALPDLVRKSLRNSRAVGLHTLDFRL
jgi:hypothetical protein